jgi:xylulokinase
MREQILALDVGTSGLKAVLFEPDRGIFAMSEAGYGLPGEQHRQDPPLWWQAVVDAVGWLPKGQISAIVLSGTMENLIAVDDAGNAVFPAILYSDPCGSSFLEQMAGELNDAAMIIGNAPEPLMTLFKWRWFCANHPNEARQTACILPGAKDFIAHRLTGRFVTDPVTATTTGLMDIRQRQWSRTLTELAGLREELLPVIEPASAIIGSLTAAAASALGLTAGLPIINGCGDAGATTLGSFCDDEGDVSLYLGTSGWVARVASEQSMDLDRPVYRLAHPSIAKIIEVLPILSAGAATAWLRNLLGKTLEETESLLTDADRTPPNLVFLPYLGGERSPFSDLGVRASFLGLDSAHDAAALAYAVLEGVSLATRRNLLALDPIGRGQITLVGGGAASRVWPQLIADILERPIRVLSDPASATALGACRIAADVLGWQVSESLSSRVIQPRAERFERLRRLGEVFDEGTVFARSIAPRLRG